VGELKKGFGGQGYQGASVRGGGFRVREKRARGGAGGLFEGHGSLVAWGRVGRGACGCIDVEEEEGRRGGPGAAVGSTMSRE
jgi:hypothetical protein